MPNCAEQTASEGTRPASVDVLLDEIEMLLGKLADHGYVDECWAIRRTMDAQFPAA